MYKCLTPIMICDSKKMTCLICLTPGSVSSFIDNQRGSPGRIFSHVHFCIKKFSPVPFSHGLRARLLPVAFSLCLGPVKKLSATHSISLRGALRCIPIRTLALLFFTRSQIATHYRTTGNKISSIQNTKSPFSQCIKFNIF